jgi:flagellar basal body P-ring formation protein FlgA
LAMLLAIKRWRSERSTSASAWKFSVSVRRLIMDEIVAAAALNMSRIKRRLTALFEPTARAGLPTVPSVNKAFALLLLAPWCAGAAVLDDALAQRVQSLASDASQQAAPGLRAEVRIGQLDPRLKLAPCADVQPYLPAGMKLWGNARIGLRCTDAGVRWNVFLPVTVDVFGPGLVATAALPAGAVLTAADLKPAAVNLSASSSAALASADLALGRALAKPLAAGDALRHADLRARQWFAAGDSVRIVAGGTGWRIHGEGQALNPGLEGQQVRVRTESGRIVSGLATGDRLVEVPL